MQCALSRARRLLFSWAGLFSIVLSLALCLMTLPASGQSLPQTSKLGPQDYQTYLVNLAIAKARYQASQEALLQAEQKVSDISARLAQLQQVQSNQASSSTQSSEQVSQEVATLTKQLQDLQILVAELRGNLASAGADLNQQLQQAQAKAKALERENIWLKIGIVATTVAAVGLGIYAVIK